MESEGSELMDSRAQGIDVSYVDHSLEIHDRILVSGYSSGKLVSYIFPIG